MAPPSAVSEAEAAIPSVSVPGFSRDITASKHLEPSGVMSSTLLISLTFPGTEAVAAGIETLASWPTCRASR